MVRELRFEGRVAVVTGAGGGIGRVIALDLARRGARVVVNDIGGAPTGGSVPSLDLAMAVVDEIRDAGGEAVACGDTVATVDGGRAIVELALSSWGRVDVLVANAAILRDSLFSDMTALDFDDVLAVNLRGLFCVMQPAFRVMVAQRSGNIVALTSAAGMCGSYGGANYSASKAGAIGLTKAVAWEGRQYGIKVNLIAPGALDTRQSEAFAATGARLPGRPAPAVEPGDEIHLLTAARVTPMAVALAHHSCPVTAEIYGAVGGWYHRYWFAYGEGWVAGPTPTGEDVVDNFDHIRDVDAPGHEISEETFVFAIRANKARLGELSRSIGATPPQANKHADKTSNLLFS